MSRIQYFQGQTLLADDTLSYDGFRVTGRSDAVAGIDVGFRYDSFGRLDQVEWSQMVGGTTNILDGQGRSFDLGDHVVGRKRSLDSLGEVFVHDGYGRMKAWYQGVPNALGQVVNATNGGSSTPHSYSSDAAHFYTDVDGETRTQQSGRLNMDASFYYRWDVWGRLTEVEDILSGTIIRLHLYDAEGRPVRTIETDASSGATTSKRLVYWGARLAATVTEGATASEIRTYGYAGGADGESFVEVSASGAADGSYALARDFQGSILALIDRTTGAVVERYRYTVFGEVSIEDAQGTALAASAFGNDRFFLGRPFEAEVGIYDLRARWYDPASGSFLSPDPLGAVVSWNLYQYGFGTPGTWMDPWGLQSLSGVLKRAVRWAPRLVRASQFGEHIRRASFNRQYADNSFNSWLPSSDPNPADAATDLPADSPGIGPYPEELKKGGVSFPTSTRNPGGITIPELGTTEGKPSLVPPPLLVYSSCRDSIWNDFIYLLLGNRVHVRLVSSVEELVGLFERWSEGGIPIENPYSGKGRQMVELPDGTLIGMRDWSTTTGMPTIDIFAGKEKLVVHIGEN